ncbi:hypothetical protein F4808DRAFT_67035 [Astrocystis sublimbata]|nr:hypothetical protein F4808DRAFT_67035 [Astrocystis sublimbata]
MEQPASIKELADNILPKQPYYLSLSPTRTYRIHPSEGHYDEQDHKHLQYLTFVGGEADRGVLLTRAYFAVREEPNALTDAPLSTVPKIDPNKPRKKVSLKDWKNKKAEGDSPPKSEDKEKEKEKIQEKEKEKDKTKEKEKPNGLSTIKEGEVAKQPTEPTPKEMDNRGGVKSATANLKVEAARRYSASPEQKKRYVDADDGAKPPKLAKAGDATPNGNTPRPLKDAHSQKPIKGTPTAKSASREPKAFPATNGRPASGNSAARAGSPRVNSQVNGHARSHSGQTLHKRAVSNSEPVSKAVPKLLSPLHLSDLPLDRPSDLMIKGSVSEPRPSPKKRPVEPASTTTSSKRPRSEFEVLPATKKRKLLPPLLSPTLPDIVMTQLALYEKEVETPSKETGLKAAQTSESTVSAKKVSKSLRDETIHVDNKKEGPASYIVTMKYKKRHAKTIERLLNLPSGGKKKTETLKKEDQAPREKSDSVEPGTARKRPRTTADTSEASKRPKASDSLRPSTPPKQATAMSRIASNSSQVGTPGAANGLTPSAHMSADKRRESIPTQKLQRAQRLHLDHKRYMDMGTKLKHQRDAIMKSRDRQPSEREVQIANAAGIQSLLLYMYAVKLQSDAFDLERQHRRPQSWKEILPLFRVVRTDCARSAPLSALVPRIQAICTNFAGRAFWFLPTDPESAAHLITNNRDEAETWRLADLARRKLGIYDGSSKSSDGGTVGKLIDRLGPWTTPEDAIPITLEILRHVIHIDGWKPDEELAKISRSIVNAASN